MKRQMTDKEFLAKVYDNFMNWYEAVDGFPAWDDDTDGMSQRQFLDRELKRRFDLKRKDFDKLWDKSHQPNTTDWTENWNNFCILLLKKVNK